MKTLYKNKFTRQGARAREGVCAQLFCASTGDVKKKQCPSTAALRRQNKMVFLVNIYFYARIILKMSRKFDHIFVAQILFSGHKVKNIPTLFVGKVNTLRRVGQ